MSLAQARHLRSRWQAGPVFGPFCKSTDPATYEALASAGFDFVIIDCEHGPHDAATFGDIIRACEASGIAPVVRVGHADEIGRALDLGAAGVQVPHVDSAETAAAAIARARFAPVGERGVCRFVRAARYGGNTGAAYFAESEDALVILQVEGRAGVANIDAILAVPGFDALFLGVYDLSQSLGCLGAVDAPMIHDTLAAIAARCSTTACPLGTFVEDRAGVQRAQAAGCRYLCCGVDLDWLRQAGAAFLDSVSA